MAKKTAAAVTGERATTPVPADGIPPVPGRLPGAPRQRRQGKKKQRTAGTWTPEQAREMGKRGGRPPGTITKAYSTVYELAKRIITDPIVQDRMLWDAQMGLLNPSTMRDLMYVYGGRPAYTMQLQRATVNTDEDREREVLRAMDPERRRAMLDGLREVQALRLALPQARVVPESTDAEIVPA